MKEILKLNPVFKDYIWGGNRLKEDFGFDTGFEKTAEGWMLACHKDGMNTIIGGNYEGSTLEDVIRKEGNSEICGTKSQKYPYFPLLIKLIDARDNLSVQVHPNDEYARKVENEFGKTETWYVLDAEIDAKLIYGFKDEISSDEFKQSIEDGTLIEKLNSVDVQKGDMLFIESGTVHAIGKGILIAEIQQNSNCTYRVFDYNRVGNDGKPRELHIEKAVDVSVTQPPKFGIKPQGKLIKNKNYSSQLLCTCDLFTVYKYCTDSEITLNCNEESFNHILVTDGAGTIENIPINKGDSLFIPANYGKYNIEGKLEFILSTL